MFKHPCSWFSRETYFLLFTFLLLALILVFDFSCIDSCSQFQSSSYCMIEIFPGFAFVSRLLTHKSIWTNLNFQRLVQVTSFCINLFKQLVNLAMASLSNHIYTCYTLEHLNNISFLQIVSFRENTIHFRALSKH